jgi:hypothetical protein
VESALVVVSLTAGVISTETGSTTTSVVVPCASETGASVELEQPTAKITAIVDTKLVKFILPPLNGKEIIMSVLINYKFLPKYVIS